MKTDKILEGLPRIVVPMKWLFVSSENMVRSPTAEHVARTMGLFADSCGVEPTAAKRLSIERTRWANIIVCMEERHMKEVMIYGPAFAFCPVACWNLPDDRGDAVYASPDLVKKMEAKMRETVDWLNQRRAA